MLGVGEAGDRRLRPSREHIIPSALGGSDGLCTFDVCEGCNSRLGETTDADLMNQPLIAIERQQHGIASYSGKIPDVLMPASSMQTGTAFDMRIPPDGEVTYTAPPVVRNFVDASGLERFEVIGSREQVEAIVKGKKAKVERTGRRMLNPDGSLLDSVEASVAAAAPQVTTEFMARFELDQTVIQRGLAKIAFGFTHMILGAEWTFSPQAEQLRQVALGRGDHETAAKVATGLKLGFRDMFLRTEAERETRHLVALFVGAKERHIAVSLFGQPLLTMAIGLEVTQDQLERGLAASNRMTVSSLPRGGDVQWLDVAEHSRRLMAFMNPAATGVAD